MSEKLLTELSSKEIKAAVSCKYSNVAKEPYKKFSFPVGLEFALKVGYPEKILKSLPPSLYESFTGAGNPQPFVNIKKGEVILDLGCGAGLDLYFYATATGKETIIYGLDIAEEMVNKAKHNMNLAGIENVKLVCGHSDHLPFEDSFFDVVTSNGIYNLSPDKEKVMKEVYRVLKPSGRTVFSEIVLKEALPAVDKKSIDDWFRCIGGALVEQDFLKLMAEVGFKEIELISKTRNARTKNPLALCANIKAYKS